MSKKTIYGLEGMFLAFKRKGEMGRYRKVRSRRGRRERGKVKRGMSEETAEMRSIDTVRRGGIST